MTKKIKRSFPLFGKEIDITFYDLDVELIDLHLPIIEEEALRLQRIFNFYDESSELSVLNKKRSLLASPELLEVVRTALVYSEKTRGAYDISKGAAITERKEGRADKAVCCSYKDIVISGNKITLNHADALVDLGSIAKGYIVDKLVLFMQEQGIESACIDARGDIRIFGNNLEGISVQHPRDSEKSLCPFILERKAVATSGDYMQYSADYDISHILGKKDVICATVIADSLMQADVIATCIMLLGKNEAEAFLVKESGAKAFIVTELLEEVKYNGFEAFEAGVYT